MSDWQTLTYDSLAGEQTIEAPIGWEFDSTQTTVWLWLCAHTRTRYKVRSLRELRYYDGKLDALAQILANTLGMASPYWIEAAKVAVQKARA